MKTLVKACCVAVLVFAFAGWASATDIDDTFALSGTFQNGATLSGTITVDITAGTIISGDITTSDETNAFTYLQDQGSGSGGGTAYFSQWTQTSSFAYPWVNLTLATSSLVNYAGGNICSQTDTTGACSGVYGEGSELALSAGSASFLGSGSDSTDPTSAPEPSSMVLLAAGLAGLLLFARGTGEKLLGRA